MSVGRPRLLVLDLDETLIYVTEQLLDRPADFCLENYYVYRRPYLGEFLSNCCKMFEIGFWTTGSQAYADLIVNAILPPSCSARFVWAVDRCSLLYDEEFGEHVFLKDLRQVEYQGFDLQNVLVVDDRPQALTNVHGNLLRVRPFHGDREDIELYLLSRYLRETDEAGDFQGLGKRDWRSMDSKLPGRKS